MKFLKLEFQLIIMSQKAIATHSLFLIGTMVLFLIFTVISLWPLISLTPIETTKASCTGKYMSYCERWILNGEDPGDWDDIEPKNCEEIGIDMPRTLDDCKNLT